MGLTLKKIYAIAVENTLGTIFSFCVSPLA